LITGAPGARGFTNELEQIGGGGKIHLTLDRDGQKVEVSRLRTSALTRHGKVGHE
jgi:hypothetical protein